MRKIIVVLSLIFLILLIGCTLKSKEYVREGPGTTILPGETTPTAAETPSAEETTATPSTAPSTPATDSGSCSLTADCPSGQECIDSSCSTLAQLYNTNCAQKCNFETIEITTSDGESYTLSRGQGSYTAAGALEWKIANAPNHCSQPEAIVPIKIVAKTTGKILGENIITVLEGKTSAAITHPIIPISFTITVKKVNEVCG